MLSCILNPAVNATGVLLHTGLGRAVLPGAAQGAILALTDRYCTLEIDTESGKRGSRHDIVTDFLCELTGAESALVVNNNAAAVMLILHTLAQGRDVILSRGQLVEIGGSFRMTDVMAQSGARLVSVGATNHTTQEDYRQAITPQTGLLMAVHRSNFAIIGEDVSVTVSELVTIGRQTGIPVVHDLGSGLMIDVSPFGLRHEPTVPESVSAGVDLTCFSGDKLLGGPQAGLVVGRKSLIDQMKQNPLMRAFRVDKLTLAALLATLELFRYPDRLQQTHPVIRMMADTLETLTVRADALAERLRRITSTLWRVAVQPSESEIGGGALPDQRLPTRVVALYPNGPSPHALARLFRLGQPAIFGRIGSECLLFDVRTLLPEDPPLIEEVARQVAAQWPTGA